MKESSGFEQASLPDDDGRLAQSEPSSAIHVSVHADCHSRSNDIISSPAAASFRLYYLNDSSVLSMDRGA